MVATVASQLDRVRAFLAEGDDDREAFARAEELLARASEGARSILPRSELGPPQPRAVAPVAAEGEFRFDNGFVNARVRPDGIIVELATASGRSVVTRANALAATAGRRGVRIRPDAARLVEEGLEIRMRIGGSPALMRLALLEDEPYLRVDLAVDWSERKTSLRVEQWLAVDAPSVTDAPASQRFARVAGAGGSGLAVLASDLSSWSLRALRDGGVHLALQLAGEEERGELGFSYAFAPFERASPGMIERVWRIYAFGERVPLFTCEDDAVAIEGTRAAAGAEGAIVGVRECDGLAREVRLHCGGRVRSARELDGEGREVGPEVRLEEWALVFMLPASARRRFLVRF